MGDAPFYGASAELTRKRNERFTVLGQVTSGAKLDEDGLGALFMTIGGETSSVTDTTSTKEILSWLELRTRFDDYDGDPQYRTLEERFTDIVSQEKSAHWRVPNKVKRTMKGAQDWDTVVGSVGRGDGEAQRHTLIRLVSIADTIPCFDGQNQLDTDHPGMRYDAETDSYLTLTQSNFAGVAAWDDTTVGTMVERMTCYHDESGNSYGNKFQDRSQDIASTNDTRTQPPMSPQFHVYAGKNAIEPVKALHRITGTDPSIYAGRYSYNLVLEMPVNDYRVVWANTAAPLPGMPSNMMRPYLRKYDGLSIYIDMMGDSLDSQRHKKNEINAHSEYGFAPLWWHLIYGGSIA